MFMMGAPTCVAVVVADMLLLMWLPMRLHMMVVGVDRDGGCTSGEVVTCICTDERVVGTRGARVRGLA